MNDFIDSFKQFERQKKIHFIVCLTIIIFSAALQVAVLQLFMDPVNIISGGFTGLSLLVHKLVPGFPVWFGVLLFNTPSGLFLWPIHFQTVCFLICCTICTGFSLHAYIPFQALDKGSLIGYLLWRLLMGICDCFSTTGRWVYRGNRLYSAICFK